MAALEQPRGLARVEVEGDHRRRRQLAVGRGSVHRRVQLEVGEVAQPRERRRVSGQDVVDDLAALERDRRGRDPVGPVRRRLLLIEELPLGAVRVALERQRPAAQVRKQHRRQLDVVADEVVLGVARRPQRLLQVGEPQLAPFDLGSHRRRALGALGRRDRLADDEPGGLVVAQPLVGRRAQHALARPRDELDLADQLGLDPHRLARDLHAARDLAERRRVADQGPQHVLEAVELGLREPRADTAGEAKRRVIVLAHADQQRADAAPGACPPPAAIRRSPAPGGWCS